MGASLFWKYTHGKILASVPRARVYFFANKLQLWRLIEKDVVSQFKPVSAGVPLTSIRIVNIIVFEPRCRVSWASQRHKAVRCLENTVATVTVHHKKSKLDSGGAGKWTSQTQAHTPKKWSARIPNICITRGIFYITILTSWNWAISACEDIKRSRKSTVTPCNLFVDFGRGTRISCQTETFRLVSTHKIVSSRTTQIAESWQIWQATGWIYYVLPHSVQTISEYSVFQTI